MGERPGRLEARDAWNGRVRSNVEEHLVCGQQARSAICIEAHLEGFRRQELPGAHDQLGATGLEALQMQGDLTHMSRLRWRTFAISIPTQPVVVPHCAA